jgi:hypothetical protein
MAVSYASGAYATFQQKLDASALNRLPSPRDCYGRANAFIGISKWPALYWDRRCGHFFSLTPQSDIGKSIGNRWRCSTGHIHGALYHQPSTDGGVRLPGDKDGCCSRGGWRRDQVGRRGGHEDGRSRRSHVAAASAEQAATCRGAGWKEGAGGRPDLVAAFGEDAEGRRSGWRHGSFSL